MRHLEGWSARLVAFNDHSCIYSQKCISMCDRYLIWNNPGNNRDDKGSHQKQLCLNDNWVMLRQDAQGLNPLTSCPILTPREGRERRWHMTLSSQLHRVERLGNYPKYPLTESHRHTYTVAHICMWIFHLLLEDMLQFRKKKVVYNPLRLNQAGKTSRPAQPCKYG